MDFKYFYRLGHQPQFGISEFTKLTQETGFITDKAYLLGNTFLDVNTTGSLVYQGEIIKSWENTGKTSELESEILQTLRDYLLSQDEPIKKLGLVLPVELHKKAYIVSKEVGSKKINIQDYTNNLAYGHWKQTKNWLITFIYEDKIILGRIRNFFDQQFWQNLDTGLPAGDMSRGLINLKLARTLQNYTKKQIIWDPFCGSGRLLVAGIDLKNRQYASDLDGEVLKQEIKDNFDFALNYWSRFRKVDLGSEKLAAIFTLDARDLDQATKYLSKEKINGLAIVTEGYLGFNFKRTPTVEQIEQEWDNLKGIWQKLIKHADNLDISEIVFCLPFYRIHGKSHLPNFLDDLVANTSYNYINFDTDKYLTYSRKDSFVGHLVLKLQKFDQV